VDVSGSSSGMYHCMVAEIELDDAGRVRPKTP
jgi:hypothetical protein